LKNIKSESARGGGTAEYPPALRNALPKKVTMAFEATAQRSYFCLWA